MRRVTPKPFPPDNYLREPLVLASFVRGARTQSGLTLEQAALATGVAKSTLQAIETDPTTVGFGTVLRVARELGVSVFAFPAERQEFVRRMSAGLISKA